MGTLEYLSALRNLDAFIHAASPEELAAADRFVAARPQFTVYSRIADRFRLVQSALPSAGTSDDAAKKRGLIWVVALARLEAGAILGTFSTNSSPFEVVGPTRWEMPAYRELLMDGAQTHYWALANDPNTPSVIMRIPGPEMLAYLRRLNLARTMLSAAARSNSQGLSSQQWSLLATQDSELLRMQDRFSLRLNRYLASLNSYSKDVQTFTSDKYTYLNACGSQLAGERRELAAGTAKVQTFVVK